MGLEFLHVDVAEARLGGHDLGLHDRAGVDLAEAHAEQFEHLHPGLRPVGLEPELPVVEHEQEHRKGEDPDQDRRHEDECYGLVVHEAASGEGENFSASLVRD